MSGLSPPPGLVVAGMHRSGTSLVTGALHAAGWTVAGQLLPPSFANPRGYYEDLDLLRLHEHMLSAHGLPAWDDPARMRGLHGRRLAIPQEYVEEAEGLADRYRRGAPWVWKNPRATLFLHAWAQLLPEATFVLAIRRPEDVVFSLLRRGDPLGMTRSDPARRLLRAASLWRSYNLAALDFLRSPGVRAVVVRVPEDLPVVAAAAPDAIDHRLLRRAPPPIRLAVTVRIERLYRTLADQARPDQLTALLQGPGHPPTTRA